MKKLFVSKGRLAILFIEVILALGIIGLFIADIVLACISLANGGGFVIPQYMVYITFGVGLSAFIYTVFFVLFIKLTIAKAKRLDAERKTDELNQDRAPIIDAGEQKKIEKIPYSIILSFTYFILKNTFYLILIMIALIFGLVAFLTYQNILYFAIGSACVGGFLVLVVLAFFVLAPGLYYRKLSKTRNAFYVKLSQDKVDIVGPDRKKIVETFIYSETIYKIRKGYLFLKTRKNNQFFGMIFPIDVIGEDNTLKIRNGILKGHGQDGR